MFQEIFDLRHERGVEHHKTVVGFHGDVVGHAVDFGAPNGDDAVMVAV